MAATRASETIWGATAQRLNRTCEPPPGGDEAPRRRGRKPRERDGAGDFFLAIICSTACVRSFKLTDAHVGLRDVEVRSIALVRWEVLTCDALDALEPRQPAEEFFQVLSYSFQGSCAFGKGASGEGRGVLDYFMGMVQAPWLPSMVGVVAGPALPTASNYLGVCPSNAHLIWRCMHLRQPQGVFPQTCSCDAALARIPSAAGPLSGRILPNMLE